MECLSCGADIGNSLGLCPECRERRDQRKKAEVEEAAKPDSQGFRDLSESQRRVVLIAGPLFILACLVLIFQMGGSSGFKVKRSGDRVTVRTGFEDVVLEYGAGEQSSIDALVFDFSKGGAGDSHAALGLRRVVTFSREDYEKLLRDYVSTGRDATIFIFNRGKPLILVPKTPEALAGLQSVELKRGDAVKIDGVQVSIDTDSAGKVPFSDLKLQEKTILLDHLSINGEAVF